MIAKNDRKKYFLYFSFFFQGGGIEAKTCGRGAAGALEASQKYARYLDPPRFKSP